MDKVVYDLKQQLDQITAILLEGEQAEAVLDLKGEGTGFVAITSHRVIFYDKAFLRKMKAVVSVPYQHIHAIAAKDEAGLLTGRGFFAASILVLQTAHGDYEFEFRGADKAHLAHNLIVYHLFQTRPS
jgi:hypothetical protein